MECLSFFASTKRDDRLAIDVGGECGVTVAGEAIFVFQFMLGASGEGRAQQKERERTEHNSAGDFHAMRRRFCELARRDRSHRVMRNKTQQMEQDSRGDEKSTSENRVRTTRATANSRAGCTGGSPYPPDNLLARHFD